MFVEPSSTKLPPQISDYNPHHPQSVEPLAIMSGDNGCIPSLVEDAKLGQVVPGVSTGRHQFTMEERHLYVVAS